jgi:hypothetical protein
VNFQIHGWTQLTERRAHGKNSFQFMRGRKTAARFILDSDNDMIRSILDFSSK